MTDLEHHLRLLDELTASPDRYARLPLVPRMLDRLTDMLVLSDELLAEFQTEDANALLWLEPHIRRVYDDIDVLVRRFAQ